MLDKVYGKNMSTFECLPYSKRSKKMVETYTKYFVDDGKYLGENLSEARKNQLFNKGNEILNENKQETRKLISKSSMLITSFA